MQNPYTKTLTDELRINAEGQIVRNSRPRPVTPAIDRFKAKYVVENECWVWKGYVQPNGYGQFKPDGRRGAKQTSPHRFAYEHFIGPIPEGFEVDHLCKRRNCCNPAHLEAIPLQENRKRRNRDQTHCKHGHAFSESNTRIDRGSRTCRACVARRVREHYHRNKPNAKFTAEINLMLNEDAT